MSVRVDTTSLIPSAVVCGNRGLGVLADDLASGGYLLPKVSLPADSGREIMGLIESYPSAGTFIAAEDGSFTFSETARYPFTFRLFIDGVDSGVFTAYTTEDTSGRTLTDADIAAIVAAILAAAQETPIHAVLSGDQAKKLNSVLTTAKFLALK